MLTYQHIDLFSFRQGEKLKIKAFLKKILTDFLFFVGFCSVIYGFWSIYEPIAYILGGIALCYAFLPLKKGK